MIEGVKIMFNPIPEKIEVFGLSDIEIDMYKLAWENNKAGYGFAGLVDLWYRSIKGIITLDNVAHVWSKLVEYSYFQTDSYWYNRVNGVVPGDYVPGS